MPAIEHADADAGRLEATQVRAMFDRVSGVYDLLNTVMTAGLHHHWRTRAVDLAGVGPGSRVLDLATGTGDLAIELGRRVAPGGEVLASDFSEEMLARARIKGAAALASTPVQLSFEWGDALELTYPDDAFDAATVGFGARNYSDLARGLSEMARVVRPGGRVMVLEMTTPTRPPLSWFFKSWFDCVVPLIGKLAGVATRLRTRRAGSSGQDETIAQAYTYLPNSVKRFESPRELAQLMEQVGLQEIKYVLMAGGIIAVHVATVPADAPMSDEHRPAEL
jgi:demethylmenaquinone methyltransferase/2-methoxy-6-polyprenyl-1,4-benzoquinol methylase